MFKDVKTLDKTNPGLAVGKFKYATQEVADEQGTDKWYSNYIGEVVLNKTDLNKNQGYDFGYKLPDTDKLYYPFYIGFHPNEAVGDCDVGECDTLNAKELPYVLMIYGCDNASFFQRFASIDKVNSILVQLKENTSIMGI
jgi:hypothetical protein